MAPAPANEAATLHSPFFSAPVAAPLCELNCNGYFACPGNARVPAAVAQLRRGASFLDAEDACLAISDKTSFLIPEDSVPPEQENCASPCMPAPPRLGSGPCTNSACALACPLTALPFKPHAVASSCRPNAPSRLQAASPFLFIDSPALGGLVGEDEFVAASMCFEQAALAVEMVQPHPAAPGPRESVGDMPQHHHTHLACGGAGQAPQPSAELNTVDAATGAFNPTVLRRVSSAEHSAGSPAWPCPSGPASEGQCPTAPPKGPTCGTLLDAATDAIPPGAFHGPCGWVADMGQSPIDSGCVAAAGWLHPSVGVAMAASAHDGASRAAMVRTLPEGCWMMGTAGGGMVGEEVAEAASCSSSSVPASAAAPSVAATAMPRAFHHKTGGPCDHCGATESPQWRRGPPAKPMLCNACGTRYRRTNQLSPAAAYATAARAAAQQQQLSAGKRGTKSGASGAASKRTRAVERW